MPTSAKLLPTLSEYYWYYTYTSNLTPIYSRSEYYVQNREEYAQKLKRLFTAPRLPPCFHRPHRGSLLVHLHAVHQPISNAINLRLTCHKVNTARILLRARALAPYPPTPSAAEGVVKYNLQALEVVVKCTASEVSRGSTPTGRVRVARLDVRGLLAILEVPDLDVARGPLCRVDSAACSVEACAVGGADVIDDGAAVVPAAIAAIAVKNSVSWRSREDLLSRFRFYSRIPDRGSRLSAWSHRNGAAWSRVQSHLILCVIIHALDDIDLAVIWPVWSNHPTRHREVSQLNSLLKQALRRAVSFWEECNKRTMQAMNRSSCPKVVLRRLLVIDRMVHTGIWGKSPIIRP